MQLLVSFFRDRAVLVFLGLVLFFEGVFQSGVYLQCAKRNSYARTAFDITEHAIKTASVLKPNVLVVGTSIAYEGISLPLLNQELEGTGYVVQTIAIPGSELLVQELALRKVLSAYPEIKVVLHFNELHLPWVDRRQLIDSTRAMCSEFPRDQVQRKWKEDRYATDFYDHLFLYSKWVAYRKDLAELITKPERRWKEFRAQSKEDKNRLYFYTNQYAESLAMFPFSSAKECMEKIASLALPNGSDKHHKTAVQKTCALLVETNLEKGETEMVNLFQIRLQNLYRFLETNSISIFNVFPPNSTYFDETDAAYRKQFWKDYFLKSNSSRIIDLSESIPKESNKEYYYDLIHLNQKGMEVLTKSLAKELKNKLPPLEKP